MLKLRAFFLTSCWVLLIGALSSLSALAGERLPYQYFAKPSDYSGVVISPDGKYFAIRFNQKGQQIIAFLKRDGMTLTAGVKPLLDGDVAGFQWVNNERVTYQVTRSFGSLDEPLGTGDMYAVNRDGSAHETLYGFNAESNARRETILKQRTNTRAAFSYVDMLEDDRKNIIIAEYPYKLDGSVWRINSFALPRIVKLNVYSGRKRQLDVLPIPNSSALSDSDGNVRVAIGQDEKANLLVQWRPEPKADWEILNMAGQGVQAGVPIRFENDNQSVILSGQPDDGGTRAVYRFDLQGGDFEMLFQHPVADVANYIYDLSNDSLVGLYIEPNQPEYAYLKDNDNRTVRLHKSLRKVFPGKTVTITSKTSDGNEVVLFVSSSNDPGAYYLFNTQTNEVAHLLTRNSWVEPSDMREKQAVSLQARDGKNLYGYLTLPEDNAKAKPMVVMVHGGPHGVRDYWYYDSEAQFLANRGYAVLQINFRGSGGYGPDFSQAGYGEWGKKMQDDITDATQWAIEQGYADANRLCIYGGSYGGYAALMGVVKTPDLYQCAIGYAGVYDLQTMFEKGDIPGQRTGTAYLKSTLGEDLDALQQRSPAKNAEMIKAKVFLAHGGQDQRVPIVHAKAMRAALEAAGNAPEWLVFDGEGHGFFKQEHREVFFQRMEAFLDQHIGSQQPNKPNSEGEQVSVTEAF